LRDKGCATPRAPNLALDNERMFVYNRLEQMG
jgi:hypothetical protein